LRRIDQNNHVDLSFYRHYGQNLFPFLDSDWHYYNSGPEKMRRANSNFFLAAPYLYIYSSGPRKVSYTIGSYYGEMLSIIIKPTKDKLPKASRHVLLASI
jgi:hypothetical protein